MFIQREVKTELKKSTHQEYKGLTCDGCGAKCILTVDTVKGYLPTVANVVVYSYIDEDGKKQTTKRLAASRDDVADLVYDIVKMCDHHYVMQGRFTAILDKGAAGSGFSQVAYAKVLANMLPEKKCSGCSYGCVLGAEYDNGVIYPKIGTQVIKSFNGYRGEKQIVFANSCDSHADAQAMAARICGVCALHKINTR